MIFRFNKSKKQEDPNKDRIEKLIKQGHEFLGLNQFEKALHEYEKAKSFINKEIPNSHSLYLSAQDGIAWCKARLGNYDEGLKECNELIAFAIKNKMLIPKFFTVRGACYKELNSPIFMERSFELANINSIFYDKIMTEQGDESIGFTAKGFNELGNKFFDKRMFNQAINYYDKSIAKDNQYSRPHFNKGVIYTETENGVKAIDSYSKCIMIEPSFPDAYVNRGNEYCYIGDFDAAIKDYEKCLKLDSTNKIAFENLEYAKSNLRNRIF